jgi:2-haloacid dehalogenase
VEEVGIYKPHRSVYQLAAERLRSPAERIAFVSANGWDAHGGATFGFRAVWCNRGGQPRERLPGDVAAEIRSLSELPELLGLR